MNFPRVAIAALAAWVVYMGIGFVVHDVLLADTYAQFASVMRPADEQRGILPVAFGFALVGFFAFAYAYAKGYEGGNGVQEGLRFGVIVGILLCCFAGIWNYMVWPISTELFAWLIDYIVEFAIYGMIVGLIYRPLRLAARRSAAV
jgi:hypothetical protein